MSHKIRFTAEGPMSKYDSFEERLLAEGFKIVSVDLAKRAEHHKSPPVNGPRAHYKKPAMELVFDALNGNKGMAMSVDTLVKAMNMPTGTISGSLAKLKKKGRVKNDGKGRWAIK